MSVPRSIGASVRGILIAMITAADDPDTCSALIGVGEATGYWGGRQSEDMRRHFIGDTPATRKRSA